MKIVIVHGSNDRYGASRVLIHEIKCLLSLGHSVEVLVPQDGPLREELAALGPRVRITLDPTLLVLRRSNLKDILRVPKIPLSVRKADAVILWTLALAGYIPLLRLVRKKFYVAVHELLEDGRARAVFRMLLRGSFPITACSHATSKWLQSLGIKAGRISVTYPVMDLTDTDDMAVVREVEGRPFTVAVYGRVNGHKGHLEVAKAFQEPSMQEVGWKLVLAGAPYPGQERALEEVLRVAEMDPRITYAGELTSIGELAGSVDLVAVFPTKAEPFGLVPIEAWTFGIRSVGFGDGGAAEVLPLVGGTAIPRQVPAAKCIAAALLAERESLMSHRALPSVDEVAPVLSAESRVSVLAGLLMKLEVSFESVDSKRSGSTSQTRGDG